MSEPVNERDAYLDTADRDLKRILNTLEKAILTVPGYGRSDVRRVERGSRREGES